MIMSRKVAALFCSIATALVLGTAARAQTGSGTSCAEQVDEQLRRFSEQCIGEVLTKTQALPNGSARIASEKDKYFIKLSRVPNGLEAESVSRQNDPYLKPETEQALKALGWTPPEVEFGGFKRRFGDADVRSGGAAREIVKAFQAFGLMPGEAISITVGATER